MKKLLIGLFMAMIAMPGYAANNCCPLYACDDWLSPENNIKFDSSCTSSICTTCKQTTSTSNGVITTSGGTLTYTCRDNTVYATCINGLATYKCASGYYGTPTNGSSGCTKCPNGGKSFAGATDVSECYMAANTSGNDASGAFTYTANCYHD